MRSSPAADRIALAGDLHDLVAHRVTAMEIQAGAARRLLGTAPAAAADSLAAVLRLGQEAMEELRRLGRLLDDGGPATLQPTPSLASVAKLPGVAVHLGSSPLPAGVEVCAVRVVEILGDAGTIVVRANGALLYVETARSVGPAHQERLRAVASACGGRVTSAAAGTRVDLPLAP